MFDYGFQNGLSYIDNAWSKDFVYVKDGRIAHISKEKLPVKEMIDATGYRILPGLIDPHVHFDLDLGFIHSRDDFEHGSKAALYGGVTTIVDFLNPTSTPEQLVDSFARRVREAQPSYIDYAFHATIKQPQGDLEQYVLTMKRLGIHSLKLFTTYSDSGRRTDDEHIIELLKLSQKHDFLLMAHIENDDLIDLNPDFFYKDLPRSRPTISETKEALKLAGFVETYGGYLYMVHLTSGLTLEALKNKYPHLLNKRFFVESCPQYFLFSNEKLNLDDGYRYTCAPPLRSKQEVDLLHRYKLDVMTIGTDHCAFYLSDKQGDKLVGKPLGIGGVEHGFATLYPIYEDALIERMTSRVATLMHLPKKGQIKVGYDADLALFRPIDNHIVEGGHGRADDVYIGHKSAGVFDHVMVRGRFALRDGKLYISQGFYLEGAHKL